MAEQSSSIIGTIGMGVTVTINHTIDADTAEDLGEFIGNQFERKKLRK